MRVVFVASLLGFALPIHAGEVEDFVAEVLQAHAKDTATLKKQSVVISKATGTMLFVDEVVPTVQTIQANWPSQAIFSLEFKRPTGTVFSTVCMQYDRAWQRTSGRPAIDLSLELVSDVRETAYALWMITLLPLLENGTKVSKAPAHKHETELWPSILVSRRNWPDVTLSFDATTKLLRRVSYKGREGGVTKNQVLTLGEHKEVEGIKLPQQVTLTIEGKEAYTWTKIEYAFPAKIERTAFEKP